MRWHDNGLEGLTYDDLLIRPGYSELASRDECEPWAGWGKDGVVLNPIIAANMITISTPEMAAALSPEGVIVPAHRFQSIEDEVNDVHELKHVAPSVPCGASIGLGDRRRTELVATEASWLFLELAYAYSRVALDELKWLRRNWPTKTIVAGNVATADACKALFDTGADIVKVGIGPGAVCSTRLVTGVGVPQLSAVLECAPCGPIIADGGIRYSGDIVKALAAGASFVMIGSLLAGTDEASSITPGPEGKVYIGMASRDAGKVRSNCVPEGISATVPYSGSAAKIVRDLTAGIRQGMALVGARTLTELRNNAVFERVSQATIVENQPHILYRR